MQFSVEIVVRDDTGQQTSRFVVMEKQCGAENALPCGLGLNLSDGKTRCSSFQFNPKRGSVRIATPT